MQRLAERAAIVGMIAPVNGNNTATLSAAIDMSKWSEIEAVLNVGVIDQTVDMKLTDCATSGGSYADITGKAITQFAATDDGKQAVINLKSSEMNAGAQFVKASVTVGNGTSSLVSLIVLGVPKYGPGTSDQIATVKQVVL